MIVFPILWLIILTYVVVILLMRIGNADREYGHGRLRFNIRSLCDRLQREQAERGRLHRKMRAENHKLRQRIHKLENAARSEKTSSL